MYNKVNVQVKSSARRDKRRFIDGLTRKAEQAARRKEQSTLYKITRTLFGNKRSAAAPVRDKLLQSARLSHLRESNIYDGKNTLKRYSTDWNHQSQPTSDTQTAH